MVDALDMMCQVVAEFGVDHVYQRVEDPGGGTCCLNWDVVNSCPSCLIGHVMFRLGASAEFLAQHNGEGARVIVGMFARSSGLKIEEGVIDVLSAAQVTQDQAGTWGEALKDALHEHSSIMDRRAAWKASAA
jgi:hypothetical protein